LIIPKETIQEIKNKLDIVGIIRDYIQNLKKTGKNWIGLCPFHNDRNPSLHINVDMGIFKCFSCGEGGDVIHFVERIENISFFDALKMLSVKAGVELTGNLEENNEQYQKRNELVEFNS
jgi:DNA primase